MSEFNPSVSHVALEDREEKPEKLTAPENHLIRVQGIFSAALAIAAVFLSLYLFEVGGFRTIAIFYAAQYACMPIAFTAAGYAMRTRSTKDVVRWGLLTFAGMFLVLLLLGDEAPRYALLLGMVSGIGEGLYWPGINLSEYNATHSATRNLYYGKLFFTSNIASVLALPVSGSILGIARHYWTVESGYYVLFGLLIGMLLLTYRFASGLAPWSGVEFSGSDMRRHVRNHEWQLVLLQNTLRGLWAYALPAFAAVLLFLIVKHEFALSLVSAATTVLTGGASFMVGRILHKHPRTFLLGAAVVPVGMLGFALQQNWFGIFCYAVLILCFDPFAQNFTYTAMYDVMDRTRKPWQQTYHFIVEREVAWNLGRVISFVTLLLLLDANVDKAHVLQGAIAFAAVLPLVVGIVQYRYYRRTSVESSAVTN